MPIAHVLLNTEIGAGNEVVKALKKVEGVESAYKTSGGVYDIIASVKADSMHELSDIISRRIDEIDQVHSN